MSIVDSTLVEYTLISPNKSVRTKPIDTITIHCTAGQVTAETLGRMFYEQSYQASSNYGVDMYGRIGMYVPEGYRSSCSSNAENDDRAITIEVASDNLPPYKVNARAYSALIELLEDICRRNSIKKLVWSDDKDTRKFHLNGCNMTCHRDFANKACPGDYLYSKEGEIAAEVNKRLEKPAVTATEPDTIYKVQVGAFKVRTNAERLKDELIAKGYSPFIVASK